MSACVTSPALSPNTSLVGWFGWRLTAIGSPPRVSASGLLNEMTGVPLRRSQRRTDREYDPVAIVCSSRKHAQWTAPRSASRRSDSVWWAMLMRETPPSSPQERTRGSKDWEVDLRTSTPVHEADSPLEKQC